MRDVNQESTKNDTTSCFKKQQELCWNSLYLKMDSKYLLEARIVNVEGLKFYLR